MDAEADDDGPMIGGVDREMRQLLGMVDVPAFARRGHDVEHFELRLYARCRRDRSALLDMVRLRLKQWAGASTPGDWRGVFAAPIDDLWPLSEAAPPGWAAVSAPPHRRRAIAADLIASVARFNLRWAKALGEVRLDPFNQMVDRYNRNYILEKEVVLGSPRLAARHFEPKRPLTLAALLERFPPLPEPALAR